MARRPPMGAGSPPARVPARQPGQSGQDGAQVRTTALVAGCKRASPSRCVLRSVTHLWTGFVTHVDVCYKDAFSRARGQSAPRPARRDDLRERKSPVSNAVSNAEISILQSTKNATTRTTHVRRTELYKNRVKTRQTRCAHRSQQSRNLNRGPPYSWVPK